MNISKLIIVIGFIAVVISFAVRNYKKDKYEKKIVFEYVIILFAIILGAVVAYQYYDDLMPIALWSLLPGVIAALLVEARRRRQKEF